MPDGYVYIPDESEFGFIEEDESERQDEMDEFLEVFTEALMEHLSVPVREDNVHEIALLTILKDEIRA